MSDVRVKIRHCEDTIASFLTTWPVNDLNLLIGYLKSWSVMTDYGDSDDICGQFRVEDAGAYFEVIVS